MTRHGPSLTNELVQCLPDILVTASPSICPSKSANHSPLLPMSWSIPFHRTIKGKNLLVSSQMMCTRAFHDIKMQCKELIMWLLRGIHRLVYFSILHFSFLEIYVLWFWFVFLSDSEVISSMIWFISLVIEAVTSIREAWSIETSLFINI